VHAQTPNPFREECRRFLRALRDGRVEADVELAVLHELTYVLPRYLKQMTRSDIADYLLMLIGWPGVQCDKQLFGDTIRRWRDTPRLGFVDAHLAALAARRACAVYTKNIREFVAQGVEVPDPLPG
jgi:predicted nucleic acid-binding protein